MDPLLFSSDLNKKQHEAVTSPLHNLLVLAGAGSGKTKVLVHRIAWMMLVKRVPPRSIMSVTFTNKAAGEMRRRIESLMADGSSHGMWSGTFHGICHRILRAHHSDANLPKNFQILDSDDQQRLLGRLIKAQGLDEKKWLTRQVSWWINCKKDEGMRPQSIDSCQNSITKTYIHLYEAYQEACDRAGLIDFAEILLRARDLLLENSSIKEYYQSRFKHIMVDEFQDTNSTQYSWLHLMCGPDARVMIVGDDDQSIYGWRGAKIENIKKFKSEFPNVRTIRLEQNYRSTKVILRASNELIANNTGRMGKKLWTARKEGELISVHTAYNELDEARFVVRKIKEWKKNGGSLTDAAILYRSNSQSRVLEETLLQSLLPYRIYGGMRFFERQEVKDALGYLRLISNRNDDAAFERIINTPTRGMGKKALAAIRFVVRDQNCTLWQASKRLISDGALPGRADAALRGFIELIDTLEKDIVGMPLGKKTDYVIRGSGIYGMYKKDKSGLSNPRTENLGELVTAALLFEGNQEAREIPKLTAFLTYVTLDSGEERVDESEEYIRLMTLHSAKGLEFPVVFMVGVEEGMFPTQMSVDQPDRLEEERRLCYVGMTRAMQKLYITRAEVRKLYGKDRYHRPSRFIKELPEILLEETKIKEKRNISGNSPAHSVITNKQDFNGKTDFILGEHVRHPKFGEGTVISFEGSGAQSRIQVAFSSGEVKWLVIAYARLERL